MAPRTLTIIPSVPVWRDRNNLCFDRKFYDGMLLYIDQWPGSVQCIIKESDAPPPDFGLVSKEPTEMPIQGIFKPEIEANKLYFREVDVLDRTPVLDIKPFVKYFDVRDGVVSGWLDKHFENGQTPERTILY